MFETQFQREFPIDSNSVSCSVGELTEYTLKQIKEHFKYSQLKFKEPLFNAANLSRKKEIDK